ncbi:MAG: o-succinylbenzoate synthase [Bacteroidetes bacterium]|nr:o-succinylbenzoate synthase [Bacteroidota bacterium]
MKPLHPLEQEPLPPIDRMDFITVRLPFVHAFGTSVQTWTNKEALLLRVASGSEVAWGECVADPDPYYAYETTQTARHIIKDFLLPVVEQSRTLGDLLVAFRHVRGHGMAKATVENALIVLMAQRHGVALHTLLGYPARKIMSGISIGLRETPDELLDAVHAAVQKRYHRVKMKIKKGKDVEWVARVRDRFADVRLMVDANGGYTLDDTDHLKKLDAFDLMMIEQPLSYSDIVQHATLQKQMRTPLCLDESILTVDDARAAIDLGACRILNIKQGRVGGLLESIRMAALAAERGIEVWSGGMDETGIGRALNIHLQTAPSFTLPGDTSETSNYFHEDIADPPVVLDENGFIAIPTGPGLGITLDPHRLERYTIAREHIR